MVRRCSWRSPGGNRNIHRDDPSILTQISQQLRLRLIVGRSESEVPGSFTEDMVVSERKKQKVERERGEEKRGEMGETGGKLASGEYKGHRSLKVIGTSRE